jgi:hypothetical protein
MSTESVGTLAEEAAKLVAVMQGWAADHAGHAAADPDDPEGPSRRAPGGNEPGHTVADPASARAGSDSHEHDHGGDHEQMHENGGAECRWCPLCQSVRLAKAATPEVREHLTNAALSLALAFKGLMEGVETPSDRSEPIEKIDLDLDPDGPED